MIGIGIELSYHPIACNDGVDNDSDGAIDALDPGCMLVSTAMKKTPPPSVVMVLIMMVMDGQIATILIVFPLS